LAPRATPIAAMNAIRMKPSTDADEEPRPEVVEQNAKSDTQNDSARKRWAAVSVTGGLLLPRATEFVILRHPEIGA
jgi:hypothetical protein